MDPAWRRKVRQRSTKLKKLAIFACAWICFVSKACMLHIKAYKVYPIQSGVKLNELGNTALDYDLNCKDVG